MKTDLKCMLVLYSYCRINNCGGCRPEFTTGIYVIQDCNSRGINKNMNIATYNSLSTCSNFSLVLSKLFYRQSTIFFFFNQKQLVDDNISCFTITDIFHMRSRVSVV